MVAGRQVSGANTHGQNEREMNPRPYWRRTSHMATT
jgi:hypothetical protein